MEDNFKYDMNNVYFAVDKSRGVHIYLFNIGFTKVKNMETGAIYDAKGLYTGDFGSVNAYMSVEVACQKEYGSCISKMKIEELLENCVKKLYPEMAKQFKKDEKEIDKYNKKLDKWGTDYSCDYKSFDFHKHFGYGLTYNEILNLKTRYEKMIKNNNKNMADSYIDRNDPHMNF
ncbi:MAG: hypothetical protein ACI4TZ_04300 [Christensenellales bacterium]